MASAIVSSEKEMRERLEEGELGTGRRAYDCERSLRRAAYMAIMEDKGCPPHSTRQHDTLSTLRDWANQEPGRIQRRGVTRNESRKLSEASSSPLSRGPKPATAANGRVVVVPRPLGHYHTNIP